MPRTRSVQDRELDYRALDMARRGFTLRQIAADCGWKTPSTAHAAIRRATRELHQVDADELVKLMRDRLDEYRRQAWRVLARPHYVTTASGKIALHPETQQPLQDDGPVLAALDRLLRYDESERRMLGIDAPVKHKVDVITETDVDKAIRDLLEKHAKLEADGVDLAALPGLTGG